jgi:hypothetical protein
LKNQPLPWHIHLDSLRLILMEKWVDDRS